MNLVRAGLPPVLSDTVALSDKTNLHFRYFRPLNGQNSAVIFLHRGHEHSGRLIEPIESLGIDDRWIFAWDARGHGLSGGTLDSFETAINDLEEFVSFISAQYKIPRNKMTFVAHSFSAVLLTEWIREYQPDLEGLILLAPAFRINLFVPFAYEVLSALNSVFPNLKVTSFVRGALLTRNSNEAKAYDRDKLVTKAISVKVLLEMKKRAMLSIRAATRINVPVLVLLAGSDPIVDRKCQLMFFDLLSSQKKVLRTFSGMRHDIFHELNRDEAFDLMRFFICELTQPSQSR